MLMLAWVKEQKNAEHYSAARRSNLPNQSSQDNFVAFHR